MSGAAQHDVYAGWSDKVALLSDKEDHLENRPLTKPIIPRPVRQKAGSIVQWK